MFWVRSAEIALAALVFYSGLRLLARGEGKGLLSSKPALRAMLLSSFGLLVLLRASQVRVIRQWPSTLDLILIAFLLFLASFALRLRGRSR